MDMITITEIILPVFIGVYPQERTTRQFLKLDLSFSVDAALAARDDRLSSTIDYDQLFTAIHEYAKRSDVQLIETLANGLAEHLLQTFAMEWLRITLHKPSALQGRGQDLRLTIERRLADERC